MKKVTRKLLRMDLMAARGDARRLGFFMPSQRLKFKAQVVHEKSDALLNIPLGMVIWKFTVSSRLQQLPSG